MTPFFLGLFKSESGATAIEYGLVAGLIALVIVGAITQFGSDLNNAYLSKIAAASK